MGYNKLLGVGIVVYMEEERASLDLLGELLIARPNKGHGNKAVKFGSTTTFLPKYLLTNVRQGIIQTTTAYENKEFSK